MNRSALFESIESSCEFAVRVREFQADGGRAIPVWIGDRTDLKESIALANEFYRVSARPQQADIGLLLSDVGEPAFQFLQPLARNWSRFKEVESQYRTVRPLRILVAGRYDEMVPEIMRPLLLASYEFSNLSFGFLTGRDVHSLLWMAAKQWAQIGPDVEAVGLLSSIDAQPANGMVKFFSEKDFDQQDIQAIVLRQPWRKILFQGHGKDDSINLGEFTVCGRNEFVQSKNDTLFPRCGYGLPCYKDETKLIPLQKVKAAEVVLSACNSGPLAGLALYDAKYILMLNAIDGCAQTVVSAVSVHDSDSTENRLWVQHTIENESNTMPLLNQSLKYQHPYPGFWHIGLPPQPFCETMEDHEISAQLHSVFKRAASYLVSDLLPPNDPARKRLLKLNRKLEQFISRRVRCASIEEFTAWSDSLAADVQSIDYSLASHIIVDPETSLMNYGSYYGDRSRLDLDSVRDVACSCGSVAQSFERKGLVEVVLSTTCVFCLRCGDKEFRMQGAPRIEASSAERIQVGESLSIQAQVDFLEAGPTQVGLFVPSYLRDAVRNKQILHRSQGKRDQKQYLAFVLEFSPEVPPQAYYYTIFAVQNLGISTYRQHFGIERK